MDDRTFGRTLVLLLCLFVESGRTLLAQDTAPLIQDTAPLAPQTIEGPLPAPVPLPPSEQTPPILPKVIETPVPPPPTLPPPPPECASEVSNAPLTANEAVYIALNHQPSLQAAQAQVLLARGKEQQVAAALNLTLAVNLVVSRSLLNNSNQVFTGSGINAGINAAPNGLSVLFSGTTLALDAQKLLFDFNHTRDLVKQARAQIEGAQDNLTVTQSNLVLQVKQNFYQYVQNLRLVTVNQENVDNSQAHLALTRAQLEAGTGLPSDLLTAQTALDTAVLNLALANNTAVTSLVLLAQSMGIDPRTPIQPADSAEPEINAADMNALVAKALKRRPEILQAQAAIRAADFEIRAAKTSNAPAFYAAAGMTVRGTTLPSEVQTLGVGLVMQWTPIDGGLAKGLTTQADADLLAAQAQLCTAQLQVVSDVSQAFLNVITAQQRVRITAAAVANAEESLKLAVGRYRAGVGIFLDVLDAQNALFTANGNRVNADAALDQARAALAHAVFIDVMSQ